ncbi:hypothetical protein KSF73_11085 [Burkholderiaceae bacterium DAT-1]|nr:hypothetical protein [Burkholderiaceae bacterium DAT-1]
MNYSPQPRSALKTMSGSGLVIAIHAALFALITGNVHRVSKAPADPFVVVVQDKPVPQIEEPKSVDINQPHLDRLDNWITPPEVPRIHEELAGPRETVREGAPVSTATAGPLAEQGAATGKEVTPQRQSVSIACSNFAAIQSMLAERLPVIADAENFAAQGISQFDMNMELQLGAQGEVLSMRLLDSSSPVAARAMRTAVERALKKLSCKGTGQAMSVNVPLGFVLRD